MIPRFKLPRRLVSRSLFLSSIAVLALAAASVIGHRSAKADDPPAAGNRSSATVEKASDPQEDYQKERQSQNRLKQLVLAMHNYHERHQHFPPAVVIGPDGKTPHSWRIELLPFLEEKRLYDQYRMHEPWDSLHNKLILRQMPDVFRSPFRDLETTNSGYYALVGRGTIFDGKEGIKIQDVTDGTSKTLMIVEAKRDIPWTKAADIPFDPDKPVPEIGGFVKGHFTAACADGACCVFPFDGFKDNQLKWAMMRNDGHPFELPVVRTRDPD
jgi:hypothetical protein